MADKAESRSGSTFLTRQEALVLAGPYADKGQFKKVLQLQHVANPGIGDNSLRLQAAVQNSVYHLADSITSQIELPSSDPTSLANQLGGIGALHSLSFDLTTNSVRWLAEHVKAANRTSVSGQESFAGRLLAQELATAQSNLVRRGFGEDTIIRGTNRGLNSIRGAVVTGDATTRSLLYEIVTSSQLPDLSELASVCSFASTYIHPDTGGLENYNGLRTDVAEKLAKRLSQSLSGLERFVRVANNTRTENVRSPFVPEAATHLAANAEVRRKALVDMLGIMGLEFLDENLTGFLTRHNAHNVIENTATIIVESLISRGVHWVKPLETIEELCQYFLVMGREEQASALILQAAKSGLIKLPKLTVKDYQRIGFPYKNAAEHFNDNRVEYRRFIERWQFSPNPFQYGPSGLKFVRVFQGTLSVAHNGHRAIVAGDMLQSLRRNGARTELVPERTKYLVSVNANRPEGSSYQQRIADLEHRKRMAMRNFAGLPVEVTSLDSLSGDSGPMANQEWVFREAKGAEESRACGLDRVGKTSPTVVDLVVAMRDFDLSQFLVNPESAAVLGETFPNAKRITGLILNGVEESRGKNTLQLFAQSQNKDLPPSVREAYKVMLQSTVHPHTLTYLEANEAALLREPISAAPNSGN